MDLVRCPRCQTALDVRTTPIVCGACGQEYPRFGEIPVLLTEPVAFIAACTRQLAQLESDASLTVNIVEDELAAPDLLPLSRLRAQRALDSVRGQVGDICALLRPLLPEASPEPAAGDDEGALPSVVTHIYHAFRDWGWPDDEDGENERALAAVNAVRDGRPVGRMLVVGAGACRLAYDLHRTDAAAETVVIDVDPLLLAVAQTVIRGGSVDLREANAEIDEMNKGVAEWTLRARAGPIGEDRFQFLLADGLEPPFAPGSFDTIVTPWFIDLVPKDLRDFMSVMHRLLKPGGQWLNLGPLRYTPAVPFGRRYTREELFDLAARGGFNVGKWQTHSVPYLVSKLSQRGKVEWVLAFAATKAEVPPAARDARDGPPAWLLFRHLPIPMFPGQSLVATDVPLVQLLASAIDGLRTLDDLTELVAARANRPDVSTAHIREAVRQCVAELHPDCRYNPTPD